MKNDKSYKLSEICHQICDGVHNTVIDTPNGEFFLLSAKNIKNGIVTISDNERKISAETYDKLHKRTRTAKGDILLTTVGASIGDVAIIKDDNPKYEFQRSVGIFKPNLNYVVPEYLLYVFQSNSFQQYLYNNATGAAQPCLFLGLLKKIKISLPELETQRIVVDVISSYDSLIEKNLKRIKILEKMAENLYKEWFVRFRFPGYENEETENGLPKNWERVKLKDIACEFGKSVKKTQRDYYQHYLPLDCLPQHGMALLDEDIIENAESSLVAFDNRSILFGAMRPYFHKVIIAPFSGLTRSTCFVVQPKEEIYRYYLYLLLYQVSTVDFANTISVGATMPYVRWKDFERMNIIKPDEQIIELFNCSVIPLIDSIIKYSEMNKNLEKQRNLLLPRLMGGKLEIK